MTDYGITASQEGVDLKQATDAQRAIDSRWRYMDIIHEEEITVPDVATINGRTNIYQHGLGFLPAFEIYYHKLGSYQDYHIAYGDKTWIYFNSTALDLNNVSNTKAILRIYNIPIAEEYTAPIAQTLSRSKSKSSRYGVKILNPNKSGLLDSDDLTDFSLNTKSKALAIHKTGIQTTGNVLPNKLVIYHGLGNPPIYMTAKLEGDSITALKPDFLPEISEADIPGQRLILRGAQAVNSGTYAYIIFKEFADFAL